MFSFFRSKPSPSTPEQPPAPQPQAQDPTPTPTPTSAPKEEPLPKLWTPQTNTKLFLGGIAFFTLSLLTTRRALTKRHIASIPPFYTSSLYHKPKVNGAGEAFEALNLATLNVISFAMMASGGVLYMLDVNGLDDMKAFVRKGMLGDTEQELSETDKELEKDVEEWIGKYLGSRFQELAKEEGKNEGGEKKS